jgi:hypothetical protein
MPAVPIDQKVYQDRIARAFAREREHTRVPLLPMEFDCVLAHVFRCACCNRVRDEKERREPESNLCLRCVREAGWEN